MFLMIWAFVGIVSIVLTVVIERDEIQNVTLFDLLLVILLGSVYGGFWLGNLLNVAAYEHRETIKSTFRNLNIVLWEKKK